MKSMNRKDRKLFDKLHFSASHNLSYKEMCKNVDVSESGAGKKIYRLMKADYKHRRKQDV